MSAIAAINVTWRQMGLDEDTARDLYEQATGKRSLRAMSVDEHQRVLAVLASKGAASKPTRQLAGPYGAKLQALWLSGWNLGIVVNRRDEALLAFVKGRTQIDHTRFLRDAKDARKAVEALKSWIERETGINWNSYPDPKDCVIAAQCKIMGNTESTCSIRGVADWLIQGLNSKGKIDLMKRLGTRLRASRPDIVPGPKVVASRPMLTIVGKGT